MRWCSRTDDCAAQPNTWADDTDQGDILQQAKDQVWCFYTYRSCADAAQGVSLVGKGEKKKAMGWLKWLGFVWKQLWLDVWFSRKPHQREVMGETAGPAMCAIWPCLLPTTLPMFSCIVFGISHQKIPNTHTQRHAFNKERNHDADTFLDHKTPNDGFGILFPYWSTLSDQMYASWPRPGQPARKEMRVVWGGGVG